ncbi:MAG: DNA topoisomerase I [Candidatus Nealsonbacteria bacterium RBG_13_37_56]|uniref:DNA topoisomerase 1 n=1 Tax=Candidatus Nealsonbacteria bacterium RBG_13_37_56 TaxID=1801661 RepID=A0A1G2DYZ7_9BACT|nr:MAG: DNA topoisomerase I [Candidatus Nealsonbacteria bacterium RBG_13_37_56]
MNLIIVESPTKSKTIKTFLGQDYKVLSSFGHVRDLPKNELGVNVEENFNPKYVIPLKSKRVIKELKEEAKKAETIILATDEDREGEAIAWHLSEILNLKNPQRIVFHEITKSAIQEALKNPRDIDMNLVDAQQARRVLDRIVGYKLSPFLWKKVAKGLSAGRVQSVTVRLVVEREREIEKFKPSEYWNIEALLDKTQNAKLKTQNHNSKLKTEFLSLLVKKEGKIIPKLDIKNKKEVEEIVKDLEGAEYEVEKIEKKETIRNPLPPFTTSTLQQEAWKRFKFPAKFTMMVAQQLYEKGHITYHRTDSVNLSQLSLSLAKSYIESSYGKKYHKERRYKSKGKVQEAHEAIRPTYLEKKPRLDENQTRLYDLIWKRFLASQISEAVFDSTNIEIKAKDYLFKANGQILKFDGFLKVYPMNFEETELPDLEEKEILELIKLIPSQHFTQPPARYTEATLIKELEENGIGRPSTYAPIISTVQARNYIEKNEVKRFQPTEIGTIVNDILVKHFPEIVDINFTAKLENELDEIADGKDNYVKTCQDFYTPFEKNLEKKYQEVDKKDITEKPTGKKCPKCGSEIIIRLGKFGKFYACSGFPKCRYTEALEKNSLNIKCPKCEKGELTEKRTKRKKIFYGCNQFPKCDFALWDKPTGEKCPECNSLLVETKKGTKCSNKDCQSNKNVVK